MVLAIIASSMSRVLLPPQVEKPVNGHDAAFDPEALIEEARRRARRRRAGYAAAALLAIGAAVASFFAWGGGGTTTPPRSGAGHSGRGVPQAGVIKGTLPLSTRGTVLFAAHARSLFVLVVPSGNAHSVTVERVDQLGIADRNRVPFAVPGYLEDLSAGPDGIYAGTTVIRRFANVPDELIRIDAKTLTIRARRSFASSVAAVEQGRGMWASIGDGRVVRLDPRTLALEASRRVVSAAAAASGAGLVSKPALGRGSLWALVGDAIKLQLVRMDPTSLVIRSRTRVPIGGDLRQTLNGVVADSSHVYLVGSAIASVDADGKLIRKPVLVPGLATAAIHGTGLLGLTGGSPALVLLGADGRIRAKTGLDDAGGRIAVSGQDAWFLGNAGRGNGIVHAELATG
jgi:hypothetical protein